MKTNNIIIVILSVLLSFYSCKKDKHSTKIGSINISDAYSLVLCKNDSVSDNPEDTLKLYKLTTDDALFRVQYYGEDGAILGYNYIPQAIYDLNKKYFILVVSKLGSNVTESYIIDKSEGSATELRDFNIPMVNDGNGAYFNRTNKLFVKANSDNYFYKDDLNLFKLSLNTGKNSSIKMVGTFLPNFVTDSTGNFILGKTLYCHSGASDEDIFYSIDEIDENAILCGNSSNGFYMVQRNASSIKITKLIVSGFSYSFSAKGEISNDITNWDYLGYGTFSSNQTVILVFKQGLLYISANDQKIISLNDITLSQIIDFTSSNNNLYFHGLNLVQSEIFIKVNPASYPLTYSHFFNPNLYKYYQYEIDETGNFTFFARRNSDSKEITGYLSASQYVNIVDNDQQLEPRQMLSVK